MSASESRTGILTPGDWGYWAALFGSHELLPAVWDDSLPLMDGSKLKPGQTHSKVPTEIVNGKVRRMSKWSVRDYSERDFNRWAADPRYNIFVNHRSTYAFDIDIEDPVLAKEVEDAAYGFTETYLPKRFRENSPRSMLFFKVDPFTTLTRRVVSVKEYKVEFRAKGAGSALAGWHVSGARYQHKQFERGIPSIALSKIERFWEWLKANYGDTNAKSIVIDSERNGLYQLAAANVDGTDEVVPYLWENGLVLQVASDGKMFIECPWKNLHTMDSGLTQTVYYPHGLGGKVRGFECKHNHCEHQTAASFLEKIGFAQQKIETAFIETSVARAPIDNTPVVEVAKPLNGTPVLTVMDMSTTIARMHKIPKAQWSGQLTIRKDGKGKQVNSLANINLILREDRMLFKARFDEFAANTEVSIMGDAWTPVDDVVVNNVAQLVEYRYELEFPRDKVSIAIEAVSKLNSYDSAKLWLAAQSWDGKARIDMFGKDVLKAPDDVYARALSRYVWVSMAARVMEPGVKVDMAAILISPKQGTGKSSLVRSLSPKDEWFAEVDLSNKDEDLVRSMRGKAILEMAEMRGLSARDSDSTKAFVTRQIDEWVPKYREYTTRYPRRSIFIGTTNTVRPLIDASGNRRWLPIRVAVTERYLDWPKFRSESGQYWAEAVALIEKFGSVQEAVEHYALEVDRLADGARIAALRIDDQMDEAREFLAQQAPGAVITTRALMAALSMRSNNESWRAHGILRMLGYQEIDGTNGWRKSLTQEFVL